MSKSQKRTRFGLALVLIGVALAAATPILEQLPQLTDHKAALWILFAVGLVKAMVGAVLAAYNEAINGNAGGQGFRSLLFLVVPLIALSVLTGCGAARGLYAASVGLKEAITIKRAVAAEGLLNADAERQITQSLLDTDRSLLQVTDTAQCFTAYTQDVKASVLRGFDDFLTATDNLNQQGVLHIKSESAQKRFAEKIRYVRLIASGIRTTLDLIPAKEPSGESPSTPEQERKLEELRALCRKASEQLRANERLLLDDLARLGSSHA